MIPPVDPTGPYRRLFAVAVVALILIACVGVGIRLAGRANAPVTERLAGQGEQAKDNAAARGLEAAGAAETARDVAAWRQRTDAAEEVLNGLENEARADASGSAGVGVDRADRLRRHDEWLCAHSGLSCVAGGRSGPPGGSGGGGSDGLAPPY